MEPSSVLDVTCGLSSPTMSFLAGGNETLMLGEPASFTGPITGFGAGDTIDLVELAASSINYSGSSSSGVLNVIGADGNTVAASLHFSGSYSASDFQLTPPPPGVSTQVTFG